ncbi:MAG TPA: diphosphomevalonate decarboxylase [Methanomassiliicoccales archaeon]|nr:diphosphomevalonate decarboxylase [Methanomassiliicoccales archaeon]
MKSSATAHPIQGLIKYHGLKDDILRLPYHDSISVCTAPLCTRTTVEFGRWPDRAEIDGKPAGERELERILAVVEPIREMAGIDEGMRMASINDFPSNIGLGASSSGFAALALACSNALGLDLSLEEISRFARRGAGSASRAVTGGFSRWYAGHDDMSSFSRRIPSSADSDMAMLVAVVPAMKFTDTAHREVTSSPFFQARLEYVPSVLDDMEQAIGKGDVDSIGELAERDTLLLHGITMTGEERLILWRPDTLRVILEVKMMFEEGVKCYFSIDTGATVYINMRTRDLKEVRSRIETLGIKTLACMVGGEAALTNDHLF